MENNIGEIMNSYRVLLIIKEELSDEMIFEQSLMLSWGWTNGYFKEYWSKRTTIAKGLNLEYAIILMYPPPILLSKYYWLQEL